METPPKQRRGFALVDPARLREISSMGGKAAQAKGTGHRYAPEEARAAGRIGGAISQSRRRARRGL